MKCLRQKAEFKALLALQAAADAADRISEECREDLLLEALFFACAACVHERNWMRAHNA